MYGTCGRIDKADFDFDSPIHVKNGSRESVLISESKTQHDRRSLIHEQMNFKSWIFLVNHKTHSVSGRVWFTNKWLRFW